MSMVREMGSCCSLAYALRWFRREIPSASLRAGSSLRLKNGSARDDSRRVIVKPAPLPRNVQNLNKFGDVK
jgi:hypothetical protein